MPNVTIRNLTGENLILPGLYYNGTLGPFQAVTFAVPDTDEYVETNTIQSLIAKRKISLVYDATDAMARPLASYTTAALPSATTTAPNTVVWNSTERNLWICDGTSWAPMVDTGSAVFTAGAIPIGIPANRFVGLSTAATLATSPVPTERWVGVTTEALISGGTGRVQTAGQIKVMPAASTLVNQELVAVPGGLAAPFQAVDVSLGTAVAGADARDDIDQTNLPATVHVTCAGNETGNTLVVYGMVGTTPTKETITLGPAGTYQSTNTFAAIYALRTTAASTGIIDIRDGGLVGLLIPQIAGLAAARFYGAIVPDVSTASVGHQVTVNAGGANASDCVIYGTDYAGNEQWEVVTMNGATAVTGTLAFRTHTFFLIGADGIAWNAGATSQYDMNVLADARHDIRAYSLETNAVAGALTTALLLPQNIGMTIGKSPIVYYAAQVPVTFGAGATDTANIPGLAATDIIQTTVLSITTAPPGTEFLTAECTAPGVVTFTHTADPDATVYHITVLRP